MIETIDISKLRNDEYIQFITDIISISKNERAVVELIRDQLTPIENHKEELDTVFKKQLGSDTSDYLKELDQHRDFATIGIKKVIEGYAYHYAPEIKEAANLLLDNMSKYGSQIYTQNYQAQTTTTRNLINDWTTDTNLNNAIQTLHLTNWALELDTANKNFNTTYLDRNTELSKASETSVTSLRKEAATHYKTLIAHISSHATLHATDALNSLVEQINTLVNQYSKLLINRSNRQSNDNE
ncbi:DUF6261 family protein [Aquimarina longa]|uniref:DUF6261 family protein n=1 Tax=Aquimarina longa TaxID=1080221 RepID=UPI0007810DC3|nr:DUF6261 family protein [Aquimarina longa]